MPLTKFVCPGCKATVYAAATAEVGHVCKRVPRPKFTLFKPEVES